MCSRSRAALFVAVVGWGVLGACANDLVQTKKDEKTAVWTDKPQTVEPNADVIWMVLPVNASSVTGKGESATHEQKTFYGLFACYRAAQAEPGAAPAPVCKLARLDNDTTQLNWPGALMLKDGALQAK